MKLQVKLFARARDMAGSDRVEVDVPEQGQIRDLRSALAAQVPHLSGLVPTLLIAVGMDYADDATPLTAQSEIACFPPVSGG